MKAPKGAFFYGVTQERMGFRIFNLTKSIKVVALKTENNYNKKVVLCKQEYTRV